MKCKDCEGKGFKEYDAGLVQIGCKPCSGIGKVDCSLTKEEFEKGYAFRSDMTVDQVREMGLEAVESDCVEGWAMQKVTEPDLYACPHKEGILICEYPEGRSCIGCKYNTEPELEAEETKVEVEEVVVVNVEAKEVVAEELKEVADDSNSGTEQPDKPAGSKPASKPAQPKKPKAKRKARKSHAKILPKS